MTRAEKARFSTFPDTEGLHHNDLRIPRSRTAAGGHGSVPRAGAYRFQDGEFTLFDRTDRPDLNASFGLQGMAEDAQGRLWCGFSGGLDGRGHLQAHAARGALGVSWRSLDSDLGRLSLRWWPR